MFQSIEPYFFFRILGKVPSLTALFSVVFSVSPLNVDMQAALCPILVSLFHYLIFCLRSNPICTDDKGKNKDIKCL